MFLQLLSGFSIVFLLSLPACAVKTYESESHPITHETWDDFLKKHVTETGEVDYQGMLRDSLQLQRYLEILKGSHPNDAHWSREEQIAYWLNAYNAFTVKLILEHYPVEGIKTIKNGIPFVNTVWDLKFIQIEGATYDLNNIEHGILRAKFREPRIHFAANCASISCPRLRTEAYTAEKLDQQLTDQTRYFLKNPVKNQISGQSAKLSKLFSWYQGDFTQNGSLRDFINQYSEVKLTPETNISYLDYNWNLNGQ